MWTAGGFSVSFDHIKKHMIHHCVRADLGPVSVHHRPRHGSRQGVPPTDNTASPKHSIQRIRPSEQSCSCSSPGWSPPCSGPYLEGDTDRRWFFMFFTFSPSVKCTVCNFFHWSPLIKTIRAKDGVRWCSWSSVGLWEVMYKKLWFPASAPWWAVKVLHVWP